MARKMAGGPFFHEGESKLPSVGGLLDRIWDRGARWVVSSWVSITMEVDWSFLAWRRRMGGGETWHK